jgi:hypothetical protein
MDSDIEEDDDELIESRQFTPEERKELDENSGDRKAMLAKNQMSTTIRGTFTCKIVKKKAQDIDNKGKLIAFGTTAMRNEELSNQQILERKQKIQKHYQGPYKKKKQHSVL